MHQNPINPFNQHSYSSIIWLWRTLNPQTREYSYYSPRHRSYSCIDFFLVNHSILHRITETTISTITISDHAPVNITLATDDKQHTAPRWRFNNTLLKNLNFIEYFEKEWKSFLEYNDTPGTSSCNLWENNLILITIKKKDNDEMEKLQKEKKNVDILH